MLPRWLSSIRRFLSEGGIAAATISAFSPKNVIAATGTATPVSPVDNAAPIGSVGPMGRLLVRGEPGCDFIDSLRPEIGEIVIDKPGNSAFWATDLEQILRARGAKHIVVMGVTTDVCVSSTMREANDRGFDCLLLEDCCGAATAALHEAVLAGLDREGGIFGAYTTSANLISHLHHDAIQTGY